jgi:hypothetical protein
MNDAITRLQDSVKIHRGPALEVQGSGSGNPPALQWFGMSGMGKAPLARLPFSSHVRGSGEPMGGNFLFEDGHVRWCGSRLVSMAATGGNWVFYYKIPLE